MELRLSIALVPLMIAAVGCGDDGPSAPPVGGTGGSAGEGGTGGSAGEGGMGGSAGEGGTGGSAGEGGMGGSAGEGGMGGSAGEGGMGGGGGMAGISFAADIQPYFEPGLANCVGCHSGGGPKGVDLDSWAAIRAGGENGPLVVPFDSTAQKPDALLVPQLEANHHNGPDDAGFVVILSKWIDEGALNN